MYSITLRKEDYEYLNNLNPELQNYLKDFYEFESVEYIHVDWHCYPVKRVYRTLYLTKEAIEKILYYLPQEHYLRDLFQGFVNFQIMCNNW